MKSATSSIVGMNVLVTGGSGFIGTNLVERLLDGGASVAVFNRPSGGRAPHNPRAEYFEGDIADRKDVTSAVEKVDPHIVIHLAAELRKGPLSGADAIFRTNVLGTKVLLDALTTRQSLKRFVALGSIEECAGSPPPFSEDVREIPLSTYSLSKLLATRVIEYAAISEGFPAVVLRPPVVYGPRQRPGMLIPNCIRACLIGQDSFDIPDCSQTRDFLHVDDLIRAILRAMGADSAVGEVIHVGLGEGREVPIAEVVTSINALFGNPLSVRLRRSSPLEEASASYSVRTEKAKRLLGWNPTVNFTEGLESTVAWYRAHPEILTMP